MWILTLGGEGLIRWVYFIVHEAFVNSFLFLRVSFVSGITEGRFLHDYVLYLVEKACATERPVAVSITLIWV